MTQPATEASNSLVNNRGSGVGVSSRVGLGVGVSVTGIGVGGSVAVGKSGAIGVGVEGWQAVMRMRHPIRSLFMTLFITQLTSTLYWSIKWANLNFMRNYFRISLLVALFHQPYVSF
jgi:hypothetical protein